MPDAQLEVEGLLRDEQCVSPDTLEIAVAAPEPRLVIRSRLYERAPETMVAPLAELFEAVDVRYEQGRVAVIDSASKSAVIVGPDGNAWLTEGGQNAIARVDPATKAVKLFPLPKETPYANLNTLTFDKRAAKTVPGMELLA